MPDPLVTVAVQAHPARRPLVEQLLADLDTPALVAYDQSGPPSRSPARRFATWRAAAETAALVGTPWIAVVQDDARVSDRFVAALTVAIDHRPEPDCVLSLYLGTRRPQAQRIREAARLARQHAASWVRLPEPLWAVALAIPTHHVTPLIAWAAKARFRQHKTDRRIAEYTTRHKVPVYATWPSLADHRTGPSLIGHHDQDRRAHLFHTHGDLDWAGCVVDATRTPPTVKTP